MAPVVVGRGAPIHRFEHHLAVRILRDLPLGPANQRLADYWLDLWDGDALPARAQFSPAVVRDLLPGIMIQEIEPGARSVVVRLCGTAISQAFGQDLTGQDLISMSSDATRARRLEVHGKVADGAIAFCLRHAVSRLGAPIRSEELHLPFCDVRDNGARLILFHTDWRARNVMPGVAEVPDVLESPIEFRVFPLWRQVDGMAQHHDGATD